MICSNKDTMLRTKQGTWRKPRSFDSIRTYASAVPGNTLILVVYITYTFKRCKKFSVLIYSNNNMSENWKNKKLCGNTNKNGRTEGFPTTSSFPVFTRIDISLQTFSSNFSHFLRKLSSSNVPFKQLFSLSST